MLNSLFSRIRGEKPQEAFFSAQTDMAQDQIAPTTLMFVRTGADKVEDLPAVQERRDNTIASFNIPVYLKNRVHFEKAVACTIGNEEGPVAAVLMCDKQDICTVRRVRKDNGAEPASLVAEAALFAKTPPSRRYVC